MTYIIRALLAMLLCLLGTAAHADEHTAVRGDSVERIAKANHMTPVDFINANKRKLKAPLYWMYIGEAYNVPSTSPTAKATAGKDVALPLLSTQATARAAKEEARGHTLSEAVAITQQVIAAASFAPALPREPAIAALSSVTPKRAIRPTPALAKAEEVPNFDKPCTGCSLETFLAMINLPADVKSTLLNKVTRDDFAATTISKGERFERMQFAGGTQWQFVTASWRGNREAPVREYAVRNDNTLYTLVYWSQKGNWSIRTSSLETSHDTAARSEPSLPQLSEIVITEYGPAHVANGINPNHIAPGDAIRALFPDAPTSVGTGLLEAIREARFAQISLQVGDRTELMLGAEGKVYKNVLQAQLSDAPLPAKCYAAQKGGTTYLLIREEGSGNWYGEHISDGDTGQACARTRSDVRHYQEVSTPTDSAPELAIELIARH